MEIEYSKLLKIDNENDEISVEGFANTENVQNYIVELIQECGNNEGDREYKFDETLNTTQEHVNCIIQNQDRDAKCESLANKLLKVEKDAKENIAHLNTAIPKGVLVIAYAKMTDSEYKFIIIKADYTEFLEEISGERKSGLPTKKKIFKSFIMNVSIYDNGYEIGKMVTFDSNSTKAKYWWKTFLELEEIRDDEKNTMSAYDSIKSNILDPLKKNHK
ncbi:MAG: nucleoid-associated protein, partial [Bacteroidia bacterium]|nr:nucleoid-associated protein [Bacteroidia bacterium]